MPVPKTFEALKEAEYRFERDARCSQCGKEIEWWVTPRGRGLPLLPMPANSSPVITHFATLCEEFFEAEI